MGSQVAEVKDGGLVAYCGLYCGDCFRYQGGIADLARDLRKELRHAKFDRQAELLANEPFFAVFKDYRSCYAVLGALVELRCRRACRGGGGPPLCQIRRCCHRKGIDGCWQCDEFNTCQKLDFLRPFHGEAHLKNLRVLATAGVERFLAGKRYW